VAEGEIVIDDASQAAGGYLVAGGEVEVAPGYVTAEGAEYGTSWRMRVLEIRRQLTDGRRTLSVSLGGPWSLPQVRARQAHDWLTDSTTAGDGWRRAIGRIGGWLPDASAGSTGLAGDHNAELHVRPGQSWAALAGQLIGFEQDLQILDGATVHAVAFAAGDVSAITYGDGHPLTELTLIEGPPPNNSSRFTGFDRYADAHDLYAIEQFGPWIKHESHPEPADNATVTAYAESHLARARIGQPLAIATLPWDPAREAGDAITIAATALGNEEFEARVAEIRLMFDRSPSGSRTGKPRYDATLTLTRK
jgi:hypothetical protein